MLACKLAQYKQERRRENAKRCVWQKKANENRSLFTPFTELKLTGEKYKLLH